MNSKLLKRSINILIIITMVSFIIYAKTNGKIGTTKKNGEGCDCHGDANSKVTVVIDGPSEIKVNETAEYTLTISGGPMVNGGTNIAVSSGKLIAGENLVLKKNELTHSKPKNPLNGKITFKFKYTAPGTAGEITIYANGNSTNNDESKKGDVWNYAPNKVVKVL
jgi:predicted carbohydrate-binding protein with CBM5 and CBM33 domain